MSRRIVTSLGGFRVARQPCFSAAPTSRCPAAYRAYHSHEHPPPPGPFSAADADILAAAYRQVPEHGFSQLALSVGARDAGYPDISTSMLPDGVFSLIRYHLVTQRLGLAARSQQLFPADLDRTPTSDKVELLAWERLMANKSIIHHWQEALAIMAQPSYVPASLKELSALSDEIWYLVGDTSADPSWYSKRAGLSMIYGSAELFMTSDDSPQFQDTRQFLRRRLGELGQVGFALGSLGQWTSFTASAAVNVLRSKGLKI